jgi:hypothetical protein
MKKTIESQEEFVRNTYIKKLIPSLLEKNNIPFYIGKTVNFVVRKHYHRKKFGDDITWFFIDLVPDTEWKFWEKHYISLFKSWGFKLENKNNGGGGPTTIKFNEQRNQKLSKSNTGKTHSEETRAKQRAKASGRKQSEETIRKKIEATTGKKREKRLCTHCDQLVAVNGYARWHGDRCRHKP